MDNSPAGLCASRCRPDYSRPGEAEQARFGTTQLRSLIPPRNCGEAFAHPQDAQEAHNVAINQGASMATLGLKRQGKLWAVMQGSEMVSSAAGGGIRAQSVADGRE